MSFMNLLRYRHLLAQWEANSVTIALGGDADHSPVLVVGKRSQHKAQTEPSIPEPYTSKPKALDYGDV